MGRTFLTLLFFMQLLVPEISAGISKDYWDYHQRINQANEQIFLNLNFKAGLQTYASVFSDFDFVFAGDCMTALQIALHAGREDLFVAFAGKGFKNGIRLNFLRGVPFVRNHNLFKKDSLQLQRLYQSARQEYLRRIDTVLLRKMVQLYSIDQLNKNGLSVRKESEKEHNLRYGAVLRPLLNQLDSIVRVRGIPMDRLIGISQPDLLRELGIPNSDPMDFYHRNAAHSPVQVSEGQFEAAEYLFFSDCFIYLTVHRQSMFGETDSALLIQEIASGRIHPKDVAFLLDNIHGFNRLRQRDAATDAQVLANARKLCYYGVGVPADLSPNTLLAPDSVVNRCRRSLALPSIELDRAKWLFMRENGMKMFWGFVGTRT